MEEDGRKHGFGRVFSKTGDLTALLTVVATILATLSIAFPWYHLTWEEEWPSTTWPDYDYTYYLTMYAFEGGRYGGGLHDYQTPALSDLMLVELILIGGWAIAGFLSVASHLFQWRRIHLASALGTTAISVLTVTVFALFISNAIESSNTEVQLEGFIGTVYGPVAYDAAYYYYGPLIGWWIALAACAIQSASSLLLIGLGRKLRDLVG